MSCREDANGVYKATGREYCDAPVWTALLNRHMLQDHVIQACCQVYEHVERGQELRITREPHKNPMPGCNVSVARRNAGDIFVRARAKEDRRYQGWAAQALVLHRHEPLSCLWSLSLEFHPVPCCSMAGFWVKVAALCTEPETQKLSMPFWYPCTWLCINRRDSNATQSNP